MGKSERVVKKEIDLREANAAVFYKAFRSMDSSSKRRLAHRILKDRALLEDLYGYFLINRQRRGGAGIRSEQVTAGNIRL